MRQEQVKELLSHSKAETPNVGLNPLAHAVFSSIYRSRKISVTQDLETHSGCQEKARGWGNPRAGSWNDGVELYLVILSPKWQRSMGHILERQAYLVLLHFALLRFIDIALWFLSLFCFVLQIDGKVLHQQNDYDVLYCSGPESNPQ